MSETSEEKKDWSDIVGAWLMIAALIYAAWFAWNLAVADGLYMLLSRCEDCGRELPRRLSPLYEGGLYALAMVGAGYIIKEIHDELGKLLAPRGEAIVRVIFWGALIIAASVLGLGGLVYVTTGAYKPRAVQTGHPPNFTGQFNGGGNSVHPAAPNSGGQPIGNSATQK